jgi:hypothetical protein
MTRDIGSVEADLSSPPELAFGTAEVTSFVIITPETASAPMIGVNQ